MTELQKIRKDIQDIKRYISVLNGSRESHSLRIKAMKKKISNVIDSHQYYIRHRLPQVLKKNEISRKSLRNFYAIERKLKSINKARFATLKPENKKRILIYFDKQEYDRLKNFLHQKPHFRIIMRPLLRKDKKIVFLNKKQMNKLGYLLRKEAK